MAIISTIHLQSAVAAAQRLQLALTHRMDYLEASDFEDDVDLVVTLLEESRDECWPALEMRARAKATPERT